MSYKTILVHVDESKHLETRVEIAAKIAMEENAHLIGTALTGVSRFIQDTATVNPTDPAIAPYLEILRQRANRSLDVFESIVQRIGVNSFEKRLADDEAAGGISLQGHYCDLIVLGQEDPDERSPAALSGFPEYVVMSSGSPTLVVPYAGKFSTMGERVLIAWNASAEAMHAVRGAMPMLRRAKLVQVAIFNPMSRPDVYGAEPGSDIALYLARHGVKVEVMQEEIDGEIDVGNALLSLAANCGSNMLVMGCYGHSRFREILLGGASRSVLESMTIPVLMAH
jgi:nucleotide-binding universal stress UspA family protein